MQLLDVCDRRPSPRGRPALTPFVRHAEAGASRDRPSPIRACGCGCGDELCAIASEPSGRGGASCENGHGRPTSCSSSPSRMRLSHSQLQPGTTPCSHPSSRPAHAPPAVQPELRLEGIEFLAAFLASSRTLRCVTIGEKRGPCNLVSNTAPQTKRARCPHRAGWPKTVQKLPIRRRCQRDTKQKQDSVTQP